MRQRGFWVTLGIILLLFGTSGDAVTYPARRYQKTAFITAGIELKSSVETKQVQPGRIAMEEVLFESENPGPVEERKIPFKDAEDEFPETDMNMYESQTLTLMTFNIRSANDAGGSVELDRIIEEIREANADIIGLQEVERMMPRSGYQDQAKIIAEELGYYFYYGGNINILGVQYGNALLSRYPILRASNHKLPRVKLEPRGMIEAEININGLLLYVYVTHLGLNSVERYKQIDYINRIISQREENTVLLGDFNNHPDSGEMIMLDEHVLDSAAALNSSDHYTFAWQDNIPDVRIDRIYTSDNLILFHHEVKPSVVSDHSRVLTQIQLNIPGRGGI